MLWRPFPSQSSRESADDSDAGVFDVAIAAMPSNISDLVIPEPREVITTPVASCDEDDDHPPSGQKPISDEETPSVGLKPFNARMRGMRKAKSAPAEDDVSSEEYDGSDKESSVEKDENAGSAGSAGRAGKFVQK